MKKILFVAKQIKKEREESWDLPIGEWTTLDSY